MDVTAAMGMLISHDEDRAEFSELFDENIDMKQSRIQIRRCMPCVSVVIYLSFFVFIFLFLSSVSFCLLVCLFHFFMCLYLALCVYL